MRAIPTASGIILLYLCCAFTTAAEPAGPVSSVVMQMAQEDSARDIPEAENRPARPNKTAHTAPSKATDEKEPLLPVPPKGFNPMMQPLVPEGDGEGLNDRWQLAAINIYLGQLGRYIGQLTVLAKWLTLAVTIGGLSLIALLWYVYSNARAARKLADAADIQTDIAKQRLDLMKISKEKQLRAYVYTNGAKGELLSDKSGKYVVRVEIRNFGQTPASALNGWMTVFVGDSAVEKDINMLPHDSELVETILPPGGVCFYYARTNESIIPEIKAITRDVRAIYAYGEIHYKDVFDIKRYARFRIKCSGERNLSSGSFDHCFGGNEAN